MIFVVYGIIHSVAKNKLPKSWTTVTPLSKVLALMLFIALPFIGFYLGTKYSNNIKQSPTSINPISSSSNLETYVNPNYHFSLQYQSTLSGYVLKNKDHFSIGYPEPSDIPLFSLEVIQTSKDPINWWNQEGKKTHDGIFNTAINDIGVGEQGGIIAKEVIGQRKSPGGATLSTSLIIIPGKDYLIVVQDNSKELGTPEAEGILSTLKFIK